MPRQYRFSRLEQDFQDSGDLKDDDKCLLSWANIFALILALVGVVFLLMTPDVGPELIQIDRLYKDKADCVVTTDEDCQEELVLAAYWTFIVSMSLFGTAAIAVILANCRPDRLRN